MNGSPLPSTFEGFLAWEIASQDIIDFKRVYVDMTATPEKPQTADPLAGLLLSQIVFYHLPDKRQRRPHRLDVYRDGYWWLARRRTDWWSECRLLPNRFDRLRQLLEDRGLIVVELWKHQNVPMHHIRLNRPRFIELWTAVMQGITIPEYDAEPTLADGESPPEPTLADGESPGILADGESPPEPTLADGESPKTLADGESDLIKDKDGDTWDHILSSAGFEQAGFFQMMMDQTRMSMPSATYDAWLRQARLVTLDTAVDDHGVITPVIRIGVANGYAVEWVNARLAQPLARMARGLLGQDDVTVEAVIANLNAPPAHHTNGEQSPAIPHRTTPPKPQSFRGLPDDYQELAY